MPLKLAHIFLSLALMSLAAPVFSHPGHTELLHSHSGLEYILVLVVIAGIIYHFIIK